MQAVKPAVVSVRVKAPMDQQMVNFPNGAPNGNPFEGTPFEKFFKQFGENGNGQGDRGGNGQQPKFNQGQGSGFFISNDGFLVTNNHVVSGSGSGAQIVVLLGDTSYAAETDGTDPSTHLAGITLVDPPSQLTVISYAHETQLAVRDTVTAPRNPPGLADPVTTRTASAVNGVLIVARAAARLTGRKVLCCSSLAPGSIIMETPASPLEIGNCSTVTSLP